MADVRFVGPVDKLVEFHGYKEIKSEIRLVNDRTIRWLRREFGIVPSITEYEDKIVVSVEGDNDATNVYIKGDYVVKTIGSYPQNVPRQTMYTLNKVLKSPYLFYWKSSRREPMIIIPRFYYWDQYILRFRMELWTSLNVVDSVAFYLVDEPGGVDDDYILQYHTGKKGVDGNRKGSWDKLFLDAYHMVNFLNEIPVLPKRKQYIDILETFYE